MSFNDDSSDLSNTDDEVVWCKETIRYLRGLPCAIKDTKRRAAADEGEEKLGALGHDYDILLHFAITHLRRADGALPSKQDGTKSCPRMQRRSMLCC